MQYGSLQNIMLGQGKCPIIPVEGMGATEICWTDRHAYTITEVSKSGKKIKVQRDIATRTDKHGMSDSQDYTFKRDENSGTTELSLRKDGKWRVVNGTKVFRIDERAEYYDYSF